MEEKTAHFAGVTIGVPTFGKISDTFLISQLQMAVPIFCNMGYHFVRGKPVDVARNEIAYFAMKNNQGFVFFRDDDTIAPRDALIKLMRRFPIKEKDNPQEIGNRVVGGVVYSKARPPVPMIHREGKTAGFEDWEFNDLVECDVIGMGCTLIPIAVFKKMKVTHYRCVNYPKSEHNPTGCDVHWEELYEKPGTCPHCSQELVPGWFRTVRDVDDDGRPCYMTEDSYFLLNAKKQGVKVYADCGVLCDHEIFNPNPWETEYYGYYHGVGPAWRFGPNIYYYPDAEDGVHEKMALKPKNGDVKFNLGSGKIRKEGYINVDWSKDVGADAVCDVRDLSPLVREHGQADEIRAYHILEHLPRRDVRNTLHRWLKALKPGGRLELEVPDTVWAAENLVEHAKNGAEMSDFPEMVIYGAQERDGDEHRTAFYEKKIRSLMESLDNMLDSLKVETVFPEDYNQQVVRVQAVKKGAADGDGDG